MKAYLKKLFCLHSYELIATMYVLPNFEELYKCDKCGKEKILEKK